MEFKAKSTSWGGCNLWKNNEIEFFDLTTSPEPAGQEKGWMASLPSCLLRMQDRQLEDADSGAQNRAYRGSDW